MHDLILAIAFISMVMTPAIVAAISGKEKKHATQKAKAVRAARQPEPVPVRSTGKVVVSEALTLPVRHTLGLAGR